MDEASSQPQGTSRFPRFFLSCWKLPLVVVVGTLVWAALLWLTAAVDSWYGFGENFAPAAVILLVVLGGLVSGAWLVVVVWLLVQTVLCCCHRRWMSLLRCWGCVVVSSLAAWGCLLGVMRNVFMNGPDWFMLDVEIPEGRAYVAPRGLRPVMGDVREPSARARELLALRPKRPPLQVMVKIPPLPNLEKLTREAPAVLQEYMIRCLYAESVQPDFQAQALVHWHEPVALEHADDPQSHVLRALRPAYATDVRMTLKPSDWKWSMPLHGGWSLVMPASYPFGAEEVMEETVAGALKLLDDSLAALAADPTPAGLDALLPQKAQLPFLSLWEANVPGQYHILVVLPAGHPAGRIQLRGYEVSTGKAVQNVQGNMSVVPLGNVCSVAGYAMLGVISGEVNEFYATEWEIWFTPEEGGESRCIGKQEFLIMGGDSW